MKLYNTITRKKEDFTYNPCEPIKIYVCGPTVYNKIHLGNARPLVVFDALRRYFIYKGANVLYVTNFTDIDDRLIERMHLERVDLITLTKRYIGEFMADSIGLNCLDSDIYVKATDEISNIIQFVREIVNKGYAYEVDGTVFFDTAKKTDYGKLSGRKAEDNAAGVRISVDERKKSPADFVLWKPAKDGEPSWPSPWGNGRPGWHIECSQIIRKYLGPTVDIHAGGSDLVFPHHENELAQSEAANGAPLARFWLHNGMLNTNTEKMSKSEGNFFLVRELAEKYGYDTLRFYLLSFHYRSPINFAPEYVAAAHAALGRIKKCAKALEGAVNSDNGSEAINQLKSRFYSALDDDFNTADAIGVIFELVKYANTAINVQAYELLCELCGVLGLSLKNDEENTGGSLTAEAELLLRDRAEARKNKDFAMSDILRDKLLVIGIAVKDTRDGQTWEPVVK
ncbi:MAG: cysteine--tRNA ligase [Defluviitaleaceae bacterium]|nr:cysteine--tRNA ligase [Defluviitaleaceae bacterium]